MSHGSIEKCEPNLTPMLDLVLQLVMFFMLCANFLMEDINATIQLPSAIQAKPLDKAEDHVIFLNVVYQLKNFDPKNPKAEASVDNPRLLKILQNNKGDYLNLKQLEKDMREKCDADRARMAAAAANPNKKGGQTRLSLVVLRADKDVPFKEIDAVMRACKGAGYLDIQLRAIVRSSEAK
jgi:biopolymer transport protein ExbD